MSDENARDLKEVENRGLTGGIDLVRNLREELRDIDFSISEAKTMNATCRAKIGLIHSRMPQQQSNNKQSPVSTSTTTMTTASDSQATNGKTTNSLETPTASENLPNGEAKKPSSERIAMGDSQAIALRYVSIYAGLMIAFSCMIIPSHIFIHFLSF